MMTTKPLLLIDVDGPLNPYLAKPTRRPDGYETHRYTEPDAKPWATPIRVWLNPAHGPMLLSLTNKYDLVWATTWEHEANTWIAPKIGLPELPVITWPLPDLRNHNTNVYFKTPTVSEYVGNRPFAWLDDEITAHDTAWLTAHGHTTFHLHVINARRGIQPSDIDALREWATTT